MAIDEVVLRELTAQEAPQHALELWPELWAAFQEGGPDAVKALLQEKVRQAKKRGAQQLREMKSAASVAPPKPKTRRKLTALRGQ